MKIKSLLLCLFTSVLAFSQSHKAAISNVKKDGFHRVVITPEVRSAALDNNNYLRILDQNKNEVPYVIFDDSGFKKKYYKKLKIYNQTILKDSITSYEVYIGNLKHSSELSLLIANTTINKRYSISGSNNQKDWYGLVSNQNLSDLNSKSGTSVAKTILFPLSNYQFLKVEFNDKESLPINIIEMGCFMSDFPITQTTNVDRFQYKVFEDKRNKKTIIKFTSNDFQRIDGIAFDVKTKLFLRNAKVFVTKTRKVKERTEILKQEISSFSLNSNTSNQFQLNGFFEKEFTIEIDNQDNQSLVISNIRLFQNTLAVVADLKCNEKYEVLIDTTLAKPNYDLGNFSENFSSDLPEVSILNLQKINSKIQDVSKQSFWQHPVFLWCTIFLTLGLLSYFVFNMLKEVEKK